MRCAKSTNNLVREYVTEVDQRFPHHDLQWVPDDRIAAIYRTKSVYTDDVVFIDEQGEVTWTWESKGHLDADFPTSADEAHDLTHFNSVQVIPDNPHHRAGDKRFKAGNVLISARNLNHIYMVDPDTGNVVWKYGDGLDWQHEAVLLIGDDLPGAGNIMLFNNRYHSDDRRSEVIELDPVTNKVVWRYAAEGFFSDTAGVAQKLPNGNVLNTSSRGGRVFEITASGDVVWQWQPPHSPMRVNRHAHPTIAPSWPRWACRRASPSPPKKPAPTSTVSSTTSRPQKGAEGLGQRQEARCGHRGVVLSRRPVPLGRPALMFDVGFAPR